MLSEQDNIFYIILMNIISFVIIEWTKPLISKFFLDE